MNFHEAKALYLFHLRYEAGRSENTIKSAVQALRLIDSYLALALREAGGPTGVVVGSLVPADLTAILSSEFGMAPATYNRYRSVFISFFDYCVMRGWSSMNPAKQLPTRRVVDKSNLILSPAQMLEMLDGANPVERIALALGMNTGLRAGDIVSLEVGAADLAHLNLRVDIQKTGGYDEKPITRQLATELDRWLRVYEQHTAVRTTDYLVPSYTFQNWDLHRLTLRSEQRLTHPHRIVQRALVRLGLDPAGEGFHTLRRSAARALFEKLRSEGSYDHSLMVVKEFLNHKSSEQTQRYLGINHERQIRDEMLRGKDFLVPITSRSSWTEEQLDQAARMV